MIPPIPSAWKPFLEGETRKPYYQQLDRFLEQERREQTVFPPRDDVFNALKLTPPDAVKVLLLGQDPYHDDNQAHGLCFSVCPGVPPPPSLANIYKELRDDVGFRIPNNGYLVRWAQQGVLMLNAVLTVRAHQPNSHRGKGWEQFTDTVIRAVNGLPGPVVFLLWGGYAQKKIPLLDASRHVVLTAAHPSPLSARRGFFGCRHFSRANAALRIAGLKPIDWQIPDI
jgi:uracil-DNA glycosylase